ncbi:hypothetical protein BJ170DRAFT_640122 [Xylariales sp. AK1849]|nr:hypothetical protein BJ170DRAFT_640122 [Xylariales sp. AK1849]
MILILINDRWSDELLRLFLQCRNVTASSLHSLEHDALVALVEKSADLPIVPMPNTPSSVFEILTLGHLGIYLGKKRGHPLNANSRWLKFAPPKMGRVKRDALCDFAQKEYASSIANNDAALEQFDKDIAATLQEEIVIGREISDNIIAPYLLDDDIQVLYETWGIKQDPGWGATEALTRAQDVATFFRAGKL